MPRSSGSTLFFTDALCVTVDAYAHDPRDEPRIRKVAIFADGERVDVAVKIQRGYGKIGYYQTAEFAAPPGTEQVRAVLLIDHLGKLFRMTVSFSRGPEFSDEKWHAHDQTVVEVGDETAAPSK